MKKTNFDAYLDEQLKDPEFAERFQKAGKAWDVALKIAALRRQAGLSQKAMARKLGTSQQQISRLESPAYEGHSLSTLRRVAGALGAEVHIDFTRATASGHALAAESRGPYRTKKRPQKKGSKKA